jgi:hydrogenase maturation protease
MRTQKTLILCVGSRLMGDDALGLVVGEILLKRGLSARVKIFETGSDVFTLLDEIAGFDDLIIVDVIKSGLSPGEVVVVDLGRLSQEHVSEIQSLHDVDVASAIRLGYELFRERMPRRILLVGVGAKEISPGIGLSEEVEKAIPKILEAIFHLLEPDSPDD